MNKKVLIYIIFFFLTFVIIIPINISKKSTKFQLKSNANIIKNEDDVNLIAVGDISFSRGVGRIVKNYKDINYPFVNIRDYLLGNDIVFGNLESPITEGREIADGEMIFRSNPGTENALKEAGFTILSFANNHAFDFAEKGVADTLNYLNNAGIKYTGAGENILLAYQPTYIEIKGLKLAFIAYTDQTLVPPIYEAGENKPGSAFMRRDKLIENVKKAKQKADLVIVSMHSGAEYSNIPNQIQTDFAHTAIDNGADLVIGGHPHVVQTMEKYREKYIFYSLGNFVFDQMWSLETREGIILKAKLNKTGVKSISFIPYIIENYSQPRMATTLESEKILNRLNYPVFNGEVSD